MKNTSAQKIRIMNCLRSAIGNFIVFIMAGLFLTGCATTMQKPVTAPQAAKEKFSEFKNVEMKTVGCNEKLASSSANQKALIKIDEILFNNLKLTFPNLKRISQGEEFSKTDEKTLQITPVIKDIKFIGGGARFWVGPLAGSSAVRMQAIFRDSSNNAIVADSEFYREAGAWSGSMTIGYTDNKMLEEIAMDIVNYCSLNR
jgi:hypothetical protein